MRTVSKRLFLTIVFTFPYIVKADPTPVVLPNHNVERLVMESKEAQFSYEVLLGAPPKIRFRSSPTASDVGGP